MHVESIRGLSSKEVAILRQQFGYNEFRHSNLSALSILWRQFASPIIYLLILAAAVSFVLSDIRDGTAILTILLLNAGLGFSQEYRSEKTAEKLSCLIGHHVLVRRDGEESIIDQRLLVPGDIIITKQGDIVPADALLLEAHGLVVDESQLTGESFAVYKKVDPDKKDGKIFAGSVVVKGEAVAKITAIGETTELGKIARLSTETIRVTQYERSLQEFGGFLIRITLFSLAIIFVAKVVLSGGVGGEFTSYLIFTIALAVAVVPEAMPVITTITLASGALQLARKHVVVKKISAIEDLGNVAVLCTDKTGTLTENKLSITEVLAAHPEYLMTVAYAGREVLDQKRRRLGSSFDQAITEYVPRHIAKDAERFVLVQEVPFDPEVRRRRVVLRDRDGQHYLVSIGSAETLVKISTVTHRERVIEALREDGRQGLRHLAYAIKEINYSPYEEILLHEKHMRYLGMFKLVDPLKETARPTIELAKRLGVEVKILTGDSAEVARYVGMQVGLLGENDRVYTGEDLDRLTPRKIRTLVQQNAVFARVTPEQKYGLIKLLKETQPVAYQGDGINDAPALKLADVGIAVHTATDIAKESADILLLKEDLGVIINGIKYGRVTFVNINKYIKHTMVGNFAMFFALGAIFLLFNNPPLLGIQLLLTTVITDLPLVAIASDNVDEAEMVKPSKYNIHVLMLTSLVLAIITAVFQLIFFAFLRQHTTDGVMQTCLYLFIVFLQLTTIFSVRNRLHVWQGQPPSRQLSVSVLIVFIVAVLLIYIPAIASFFSFSPLSVIIIGWLVLAQIVYVGLIDVIKHWYYQITPIAGERI